MDLILIKIYIHINLHNKSNINIFLLSRLNTIFVSSVKVPENHKSGLFIVPKILFHMLFQHFYCCKPCHRESGLHTHSARYFSHSRQHNWLSECTERSLGLYTSDSLFKRYRYIKSANHLFSQWLADHARYLIPEFLLIQSQKLPTRLH